MIQSDGCHTQTACGRYIQCDNPVNKIHYIHERKNVQFREIISFWLSILGITGGLTQAYDSISYLFVTIINKNLKSLIMALLLFKK